MKTPIRVLHLEDNPLDRGLVRDALAREGGFELAWSTLLDEFAAKLAEGQFDIVLSDSNIAGHSGLEAFHAVRAVNPNIPVVFLTGTGSETLAVECMKHGAADYVVKTVDQFQRLPFTLRRVMDEARKSEILRAKEALRVGEERYRLHFENAFDGVFSIGRDLKILEASPSIERLSGYKPEELIGKSILDLTVLPSKFLETAFSDIRWTFAGEKLPSVVYELISKDGTRKLDEISAAPLIRDGEVVAIVCVIRDITERKQAEHALRESEERHRQLGELSSDTIAVHSDGKIVYINSAGAILLGAADPEHLIGEPILDFVHPEYRGIVKERFRQMAEEGKAVPLIEEKFIRLDGTTRDVEVAAIPCTYRGKSAVQAVVRDITERKRAVEQLRKRVEQEIQNLAKFPSENPYPVLRIARDGQLLYINEAGVRLLSKWHPRVDQAAPPKLREAAFQSLNNKTAQVIDLEYGERVISFHVVPIVAAGYTNLYARDITERGRAEAELAQSHEQLRALTLYWQTAIEAERAHIAREIHDDFGQSMTALKMDLSWLANRLPDGDERVERIRGMNTLVDESIALMRRIASSLRPNLLDDLGLNAALEWQAQEFSRRCGIPCKLNLPKDDLALDPALSTTLFRIFQETLTNVARHAQATRVNVSLQQKERTLILTMRDNGRGIPEAELNKPRSLGLLGLCERAALWRGKTTIRGVAGKGTTVTVRIPLPASPLNGGKR